MKFNFNTNCYMWNEEHKNSLKPKIVHTTHLQDFSGDGGLKYVIIIKIKFHNFIKAINNIYQKGGWTREKNWPLIIPINCCKLNVSDSHPNEYI